MELAQAIGDSTAKATEPLLQPAFESFERISQACDKFLQWERENIFQGNPTAEQLERHRKALKWMLRIMRLIHTCAAEPEYPDKSFKSTLENQIWRLEQSWELCFNPMPSAEAEKILAEVFPG